MSTKGRKRGPKPKKALGVGEDEGGKKVVFLDEFDPEIKDMKLLDAGAVAQSSGGRRSKMEQCEEKATEELLSDETEVPLGAMNDKELIKKVKTSLLSTS